MHIGVPKEIKPQEFRVALMPEAVAKLVADGHQVLIETNAGEGIGIKDAAYQASGASIADCAKSLYEQSELLVKVKEPQPNEYAYFRPDQTLFCFLHLAAEPALTQALLSSNTTAIAFETVEDEHGQLPLLAPMSLVAGRVAVQAAAKALEKYQGGRGCLLGGIAGVPSADVLVLGAGMAGSQSVAVALGMGANVTVYDRSQAALDRLTKQFSNTSAFGSTLTTALAGQSDLPALLAQSDAVIGAVLIPGAAAPKLVSRDDLSVMKPGAVLVDIAIDQGGCFESSRPTSHANPTFVEQGVIHYCVTNMPGAVPLTSSAALSQAILPYVQHLATSSLPSIERLSEGLQKGVNCQNGKLLCDAVKHALH